jgi:hypothetical protein
MLNEKDALSMTLSCHYPRHQLPGGGGGGHTGAPGRPQPGFGKAAVADWWLTKVLELVVVAAAAPATTTNRAKIRMASFIVSDPFRIEFAEYVFSAHIYDRENQDISPVISLAYTNNNRLDY